MTQKGCPQSSAPVPDVIFQIDLPPTISRRRPARGWKPGASYLSLSLSCPGTSMNVQRGPIYGLTQLRAILFALLGTKIKMNSALRHYYKMTLFDFTIGIEGSSCFHKRPWSWGFCAVGGWKFKRKEIPSFFSFFSYFSPPCFLSKYQ